MSEIRYPYLPDDRIIRYVGADHPLMVLAKEFARQHSSDKSMPNTSVLVRDGRVIGIGANGSNYHDQHGCRRVELKCPSGQGYELCEGCHPKNHGEARAVRDAQSRGNETAGVDLYLWGHWWCCQDCWEAMIAAGIRQVYLLEGSEVLFNREHPDNVIGHQFD
jgi:deoxycytidylate deaminase